jgi:thioredoxin 1
MLKKTAISLLLALCAGAALSQRLTELPAAKADASQFPPLALWEKAVLSGDSAKLNALYSTTPPVRFIVDDKNQKEGAAPDVEFLQKLKQDRLFSLHLEIHRIEDQQPNLKNVIFQAEMRSGAASAKKTSYVIYAQLWQLQGSEWRMVTVQHSAVTRLKQPLALDPDLYPAGADAAAEIQQALTRAAREHKRVLLIFGGNWCYDCDVLDLAFHSGDIQPLLDASYVYVHVDIGKYDKNLDLADRYKVPIKKGVPAIAVLDSDGKLLYSQQAGEFESARHLAPDDIIAFLNKWKPK